MEAGGKKTTDERISRSAMRKALLRSGYLLEQRVEALLMEYGYYVEGNWAYPDEATGKSRELDIFAITALPAGPGDADMLFPILLCECENNYQPLVFFTKTSQVSPLHHYDVKMSGLPVQVVMEDGGLESLSEFLGMDKYHHYCQERISTQYCSFRRVSKGADWIALHLDEQHGSLDSLAAAVEASTDNHYADWVIEDEEPVNVQILYPVLILEGPLYQAYVEDSKLRLRQTNLVAHRKEYHSAEKHETYQIDVIVESYLPRFLDIVDAEVRKTARLMRRRRDAIKKSVDHLVSQAKAAGEDTPLRKIFEF
jgi:hypothetical protein